MEMLNEVKHSKTIVGFNEGHNGGCTIIHNGKIISIAEERLNRKKYSEGYLYSFAYCIEELGININDIDLFVSSFYGDYLEKNHMGMFKGFTNYKSKFITVDHHFSHASSCYYLSPYNESLIIVIDGQGNLNDTESYYIGKGNTITKIGGNNPNRSKYKGIGRTYETFTNYCGWSAQEAGKTMGLAACGKEKYPEIELFDINDNLEISSKCEGKYIDGAMNFIKTNNMDFGGPCKGYENRDAAYYVQVKTEKIILELINKLYNKYKIKNLCVAGGVFLNGIINQKILEQTPIENLFIVPCCDDTGQSLGNALYGYHQYYGFNERIKFDKPYLGKEYNDEDYLDVLEKKQRKYILPYSVKSCNFKYKKSDNIYYDVAQILSNGKIIGWFQGKSEIGPRALGNRSILCSPFPNDMKDTLNLKIKHREPFRPFAPAVLEEKVSEYFKINGKSPYMLKVPVCTEKAKNQIPATLHVDYTGRVQTVNRDINEKFYDLINEFYKVTNIPVLLNTSFNDNGEPIVETPKDALVMFCKSNLDYLILGDYIV